MTTCAYCRQRKGKRSCPALRGAICPSCCGKHRLQEIDCPSECVHLGGLSVVRDPTGSDAKFTNADYDTILAALGDHARGAAEFGRSAMLRIYGQDPDPEDWEAPIGMAYLYYGHRDASGRRMIDHFLAARGRGLRPSQAAAAVALQRAWASLFEITSVQAGAGMVLRDLLSGESLTVREVSATSQLKRLDVLFAWLMPVSDHLELTGASCVVPRPHLDRVRAALNGELERARGERPGIPDRELVGSLAWIVLVTLRDAFRAFRPPELRTTDGEAMVISKAHYTVADEDAVRAGLAALADLEADGDGFTWLARGGNAVLGPGPMTLGRLHLEGGELALETTSRERLERGRRMLEESLGERIRHRADSFGDFEAAMREARVRPSAGGDELPAEVRREIVGQYLRDHYRRWLDTALPALEGKTPRDAVRTPAGRAKVEALLADIEHGALRQDGGDTIDFAAMRRELGLASPDELDEELRYDAAQPPDAGRWLELDDHLKARAVEAYHRALAAHPKVPDPHMHAMMHIIVENQLALGDPPEARAALERLLGAGLSRHAAVHAVGSVVAEALWKVLRDHATFDRRANARALERLRPEGWSF